MSFNTLVFECLLIQVLLLIVIANMYLFTIIIAQTRVESAQWTHWTKYDNITEISFPYLKQCKLKALLIKDLFSVITAA